MSHSRYDAAPCEVCLAEDASESYETGWGQLDGCLDSRLTQAYIIWHLLVYAPKLERQEHVEAFQQMWSPLSAATISNITWSPCFWGLVNGRAVSFGPFKLCIFASYSACSAATFNSHPDKVMWDLIDMSEIASETRTMSKC